MSIVNLGFRYGTPLVIPDSSSVDDPKTFEELNYIFNALRTLATQLDAATGQLSPLQANWSQIGATTSILGNNINKFYALCSEDIAYGAFVNFTNSTPTTVTARNAQASAGTKAAHGFCVTQGGFASGTWGEFVVGPGLNYGITGLVPGTTYYLSPTSSVGQVQSAVPVTAGQIRQICGVAISNTQLLVGPLGDWTQL